MSAIDATKPTAGTALTADVRANFLAAKNEIDTNTAAAAAALAATNAHSARVDNPHALTATQVGLGSVNNTTDAAKPVSTAQAAADTVVAANAIAALSGHTTNVANPHAVTAAQVGLGSVDNTSDAGKPVSTAQQAALNLKASLASPTFTGAVTLPGGQVVNGVTLTAAGSAANFLRADGTYGAPAGAGDMVLASAQTNTGAKTFNAGTLLLRNVANTISSLFTNAATVARTWTLPDKDGTVAMTSDITGTNTGTNTGDNATNTLYSGLSASKQDLLVSATNIKSVNGTSLVGAGNIVVSASPGGSTTQLQFNNASAFAGSAAIRAVLVTGSGGFTDATNPRLHVGVAGNSVCLHGNFGEMYLLNETATGYASINLNQLYATNRVLTDYIIAPNNTYCAASSTAFTYSGFRAGSGSGMWWASTSNGANNDAVIEVGFVRDAAGVIGVSLVAGGYGDLKAKNFVVDNVVKLKNFTVATLPSAATSGAGAQAYVTDATAPAYNTTVAGGGAVKLTVVSDGTNWKT